MFEDSYIIFEAVLTLTDINCANEIYTYTCMCKSLCLAKDGASKKERQRKGDKK